MFIKINDKKQVVMQIVDEFAMNMTPDNVITFMTKNPPEVSRGEHLFFNPEIEEFYIEQILITDEQKQVAKEKNEAIMQKKDALKWLSDNEWKAVKRITGEWVEDDERWVTYLADRVRVRAQYDEAEAILNRLKSI